MATVPGPFLTPQQYLERERRAEIKSEYLAGQVFAMVGATRRHNLIAGNVARALGNQFQGRPCEVYQSDVRVNVRATGLYTYPDVVALCGQPQFEDAREDTLLNPQLVAEVLSQSTEDYDRGRKFAHYRRVDSLTDYLLIAQDQPRVEHHLRQETGQWLLTEYDRLDQIVPLGCIGCELKLAETYEKVQFGGAEQG